MLKKTPFGAALRHFRKKKRGLSQKRLGDAIGVSQAMISKIEKGLGEGSKDIRDKILLYFEISHTEFIKKGKAILGEDNKKNTTEKQLEDMEERFLKIRDIIEDANVTTANSIGSNDPAEKRMRLLLGQFKHPALIEDICKGLLELETYNESDLKEIRDLIDFKLQRYKAEGLPGPETI